VTGGAEGVLLQYGALGVFAMFATSGIVVMFRHTISTHAEERRHLLDELEQANRRAERGEDELRKLNDAFRERYVIVLGEATRAVTDALDMVRQARRSRE
jgi:hypothetical protein